VRVLVAKVNTERALAIFLGVGLCGDWCVERGRGMYAND